MSDVDYRQREAVTARNVNKRKKNATMEDNKVVAGQLPPQVK